jgi:hypothetical protein
MYSPDGYALFVGSKEGWCLWSVYGHLLASSSLFDRAPSAPIANGVVTSEGFMDGVMDCCWTTSGLSLLMLGRGERLLYSLPFSRSAVTTCYNPVQ